MILRESPGEWRWDIRSVNASVVAKILTLKGKNASATERTSFTVSGGEQLTGLDSSELTSDYAMVNWGDNSSDTSKYAIQSNGDVDATHSYARAGDYAVHTTFYDAQGDVLGTVDSLASVDPHKLSEPACGHDDLQPPERYCFWKPVRRRVGGHVHRLRRNEGQGTEYAATINWGDGATTAGVVSGSTGDFTVGDNTNHVYLHTGTYHVDVTVDNDEGSAATSADEDITESQLGYGGPATSESFPPG